MTTAALEGVEPEFDLADRMRKALRYADVGVAEMASYLDVSRNTIGNWINGRVAPPAGYVKLWALRTGVSYRWLKGLPRVDSNHQPAGDYGRRPGYPPRPVLSAA